ncbi:MAG: hypothetical protein AAGC55_10680, partial [Myxococcota bacterium]
IVLEDDGTRQRMMTGGVAVRRDLFLTRHLHLGLSGELARSFYATLHSTATVQLDWTARLSAELAFRASSH